MLYHYGYLLVLRKRPTFYKFPHILYMLPPQILDIQKVQSYVYKQSPPKCLMVLYQNIADSAIPHLLGITSRMNSGKKCEVVPRWTDIETSALIKIIVSTLTSGR